MSEAELLGIDLEKLELERHPKLLEARREASQWVRPRSLAEQTPSERIVQALSDVIGWKRPSSLATGRQEYTFTDEQFRVALASLDRNA